VDVASDVDERQVGRHRLGDQARPDANHSSFARTLDYRVVRSRPVPVPGKVRHPASAAKAHVQQCHGDVGLSARRRPPVQNIREYRPTAAAARLDKRDNFI